MESEITLSLRKKLLQLERELDWHMKSEMSCCGITLSQCHLIDEIGTKGEVSLVELASALKTDTSTLSRNVDGLVRLDLANRIVNPSDRRYVAITLTEKGKQIYESIERFCSRFFSEVFRHIPAEKQSDIIENVGLLVDAIIKCAHSDRFTGCCEKKEV